MKTEKILTNSKLASIKLKYVKTACTKTHANLKILYTSKHINDRLKTAPKHLIFLNFCYFILKF